MNIYQRYLSRFLIFFSSLFIIFFLLIESNFGFKWIFNITSQFFLGLKTEDISGNWRNFTLKNISCNIFDMSIQANNINIVIDIQSLFKVSTIFKKIETNNLIVSLNSDKENIVSSYKSKNILKTNILKKNFFFNNPIIFQKIHVDKILLKSNKNSIFLFDVFSSIKLFKNNFVVFPLYIDSIYVKSSKSYLKKSFKEHKFNIKNNIINFEKINNFLSFLSKSEKIIIPFNVDIKLIKCKKVNFFNFKKNNLSQIELKIKIKDNILHIKKMKLSSNFFKIQSYGKIIFNNNCDTLFFIKNKISIPIFYKKTINISLQGKLNNKLIFQLQTNSLFKINLKSIIFLNILNYPFYIKLDSNHLFFPFKKDFVLNLNHFQAVLRGKINDYFLSLKNIFNIKGLPSIFFKIKGRGNLKDIFLQKINFFPLEKKLLNKKIVNSDNNVKLYQDLSNWRGGIDILNNFFNKKYNLCIPQFNLEGSIMKKKLSILGSLYYRNFNMLEIPKIDCFLGRNKLYFTGYLGKKINIDSSIYADDLNYVLPNLKGHFQASSHMHGFYFSPTITSNISANNLSWYDIYLKKIKIFLNINITDSPSGEICVSAKKICFSGFCINSFKFSSYWNHQKQQFFLLLENNGFHINFILNGAMNHKTGNWNGCFKEINIQTIWGKWIPKNNSMVIVHNINTKINHFYKNHFKTNNIFSSIFYKIKLSLFNIYNHLPVNLIKKISFKTQLKFILKQSFSDIKFIFKIHDLKLENQIQDKIFIEYIHYLKLIAIFKENNLITHLTVQIFKDSLKKNNISGYFKITDIYKEQKIEGMFILSHFPFSFFNFFIASFEKVQGTFNGKIKIFRNLYQPKISSNIIFNNISIKSNHLLKYMHLFFNSFLNKIENIKINQEIIVKTGSLFFSFDLSSKKHNIDNITWSFLFNSNNIIFVILPKIELKCSSQLHLNYSSLKYNLIGYIKSALFFFKINEKNFDM